MIENFQYFGRMKCKTLIAKKGRDQECPFSHGSSNIVNLIVYCHVLSNLVIISYCRKLSNPVVYY